MGSRSRQPDGANNARSLSPLRCTHDFPRYPLSGITIVLERNLGQLEGNKNAADSGRVASVSSAEIILEYSSMVERDVGWKVPFGE